MTLVPLTSRPRLLPLALSWAALAALFFVPMAVQGSLPVAEVLRRGLVFFYAPALLSSWVQTNLYHRLPTRLLSGGPAAGIIIGNSVALAGIWTALAALAGEPLPPDSTAPPEVLRGLLFTQRALMLGTFSAVALANLLASRLRHESEQRLLVMAQARESQLLLLRSKLNPHFLFNSLNSVVALVDEDPAGAQRMVRDISQLLRRSLALGEDGEHTVDDELEFARLYLACEQVRFEDRLQVQMQVKDGLGEERIPAMLLHPLVENAIKHGMRQGPPVLRLSVRVDVADAGNAPGGDLVLEVRNTGRLRPADTTASTADADADADADHGIGTAHILDRLQSRYGDRRRLTLEQDGDEVVARLRLPRLGVSSPRRSP